MLREYAIEPTLIADYSSARYFLEKFGCDRGRLIAMYPSNWKRAVFDALSCPAIEKKRVTELLNRIAHAQCANRPGSPFDPAKDWLPQAIAEDARLPSEPFELILANGVSQGHKVVNGHEVDEADARWAASHDRRVRRAAGDMADAIQLLLGISSRILFVDPYFDGNVPTRRAPILEFIRRAISKSRSIGTTPVQFEIHSSNPNEKSEDHIQRGLRAFAKLLPQDVSVVFRQWAELPEMEQFHNRYVLTDVGGVEFASGLDEKRGRATDRVSLLSESFRRELWSDLDPSSGVYTLEVGPHVLRR